MNEAECQRLEPGSSASDDAGAKLNSSHCLIIIAATSAMIYGVIACLSPQFDFHSPPTERPIVVVLVLFVIAFAIYVCAICVADKSKQSSKTVRLIVGTAIAFRLNLLFSVPIQEVDIYRYLWDGMVSTQHISPFQFPPDQIINAPPSSEESPELRKLVKLRDRNAATSEVLSRVHFADLPTVYPPTSQTVFYLAAMSTSPNASVKSRIWMMKFWLIGFDLGTLFLVIKLLQIAQLPLEFCLIYAWCPLVLKEIANSGHLDAIAVFLTTWAIYITVQLLFDSQRTSASAFPKTLLAAVVLAAAIGAKLYPIILAPLILSSVAKRFGWRVAFVQAVVLFSLTFIVLRPMMPSSSNSHISIESKEFEAQPIDPSAGLATFLKTWEMNDFLFMVVVENLKPSELVSSDQKVWFSFMPEAFRKQVTNSFSKMLRLPVRETPFMVTRFLTAGIFVILALMFTWQGIQSQNATQFCHAAFLTLAWFWLLCPTQNPWYWIWALPLLAFTRNRAWIAVSGIVMVYYLRFMLDYHYSSTPVAGTSYQGTIFFDLVVTWLEFAPWFVWLAIETIRMRTPVIEQ